MQNYFDYEIEGVPHRSGHKLSDTEIDEVAAKYKAAGMTDPTARQQEKYGREELIMNKGLQDAYQQYYQKRNGKRFEGSPEELVDHYMEQMRYFDTNIGSLGTLVGQLSGNTYDENDKAALNVMFDTWDKTVPFYAQKTGKWKGLVDHLEAAATDPANLASLATVGTIVGAPLALAGRQASKEALKLTVRNFLKKGLVSGAIEGAYTSAAQNGLKQQSEIQLGRRDAFSGADMATDTLIGAGVGGLLGGALGKSADTAAVKVENMANQTVTQQATTMTGKPTRAQFSKISQGATAPEIDETLRAAEKFAMEYNDPHVVNDARKAARDAYVGGVADRVRDLFDKRGGSGKPVTYQQAKAKTDEWLTNIGANDQDDFHSIVEKMVKTKIDPTKIGDFTPFVNGIEAEALKHFDAAYKANSPDTVKWFETFANASALASGVSSGTGRGLNFQAKRFRDNLDMMTMTQVIQGLSQTSSVTQARNVLQQMQQQMANGVRLTAAGVNELYRYNVLAGAETIGSALMGSMARLIDKPATRLMAGIADADIGLMRQSASQLAAIGIYSLSSLKFAAQAFYHSKTNLGSQFVEGASHNPVLGSDLNLKELGSSLLMPKSLGQFADGLVNAHRFVGRRGMQTVDEFTGQLAFQSRVYAIALEQELSKGVSFSQARTNADNLVKQAVNDQLQANITGKAPTNPLTIKAIKEADEVRFMQKLPKDGDLLGAIAHGATKLRDQNAVTSVIGSVIMPFVRSPMNMAHYTFERTPVLSLTSKNFRDAIAAGGQRGAEAEAGLYIGGMLWTTAILATTFDYTSGNGKVNGLGKPDKATNGMNSAAGMMPNSLLIDPETGKRVDLKRADPFTKQALVMASVHDILRYGTSDDQQQIVAAMAMITAKNLLDNPASQGLRDLVDSLDDMGGYAQRRAGSFVPLFRIMRNWTEGDFKEAHTLMDEMKKNIPGLSNSVDSKRDPLTGEPLRRQPQLLYTFNTSREKDHPVYQEIQRLGMSMNPPSARPADFGGRIDLTQFKMASGRTLYDHYQDKLSKLHLKEYGGKDIMGAIEDLIKSPAYQEALMDPTSGAGYNEKGSKAAKITERVQFYRKAALMDLMNDPEVPNAYKQQVLTVKPEIVGGKKQGVRLAWDKLLNGER